MNTDLAIRDREVFACGHNIVTIDDVIRAAHFRGELGPSWERVLAFAENDNDPAELIEADLQARSEQFRIDHDLISAEETERWLEERGLSLQDFGDFLSREGMDNSSPGSGDEGQIKEDYAFAPPDSREVLRVELLFSGTFDELASRLAWRFAAREASAEATADEDIHAERDAFFARSGLSAATLPAWLAGLGVNQTWLDEMLALEAIFRRQTAAQLTPHARERMARSLRVSLTRFELEVIELDSRDAAREAFECVSRDGESLEDVAEGASFPFRRFAILHDELPEDLRQSLLCAMPNEVLPPFERDGRFQLYRLLRKIECDLADDSIRHRIDSEIVGRHFADLTARFVRWILPPDHVV